MAKKKKTKLRPPNAGKGKEARAEQHENFCLEFVVDRNAARAARAAGYSEAAAKEVGYKLLTYAHIKQRISDLTAERFSKVIMEGEEVMRKIQAVGTYDPRRIFDKNGNVLPPAEWPDDIAAAIGGFEVRETYHPVTGRKTGYVKKVKWKDSLKALEDVAQHKGVLKQPGDVNVNVPVTVVNEDEVKKSREKIKNEC